MERLHRIKECLIAQVESQMGNLAEVDAKEMGEVIDMIKDIEEAIYYCTVTEAMTEKEYGGWKSSDRMYYGERNMGMWSEPKHEYPVELKDHREGRSPKARRMYMESKEMHKDKAVKMQELEKYMHELSNDMTEMITEASPEEKQIMKNKLTTLAGKIV